MNPPLLIETAVDDVEFDFVASTNEFGGTHGEVMAQLHQFLRGVVGALYGDYQHLVVVLARCAVLLFGDTGVDEFGNVSEGESVGVSGE